MKEKSTFYTAARMQAVQANVARYGWAREMRDEAVQRAQFWLEKSDDELWSLMFSPTLRRAFHVKSDGRCLECGKPVLNNWIVDAQKDPWKVRCPFCGNRFPKNDFYAYYKSGLDSAGFFRYELADDTLLTYDETPGDCTSLYRGHGAIDDGEGAAEGWFRQERWYYIAYYLTEGQWRQLVVAGIMNLSSAYFLTGDKTYAHKAAILLDRVADLLPLYNYARQGLVYERPGDCGYVTTWHDSNVELRSLVIGYDMIFNALDGDTELAEFLSEKAQACGLENAKASVQDIRKNIETRILVDIQRNRPKIHLNYPGEELLLSLIGLVLGDEKNVKDALAVIEQTVAAAIETDGVTGERGIGGYAALTADSALLFLELLYLYDEDVGSRFTASHPQLEKTFRFITDLHLLGKYYPLVGDTHYFGAPVRLFEYIPLADRIEGKTVPGFNLYSLIWKLCRSTGNEYYRDVIRKLARQYEVRCDIGDANAEQILAAAKEMPTPLPPGSLDLAKWQLAILASGKNDDTARALWMHYLPVVERHGHLDALNIGLFAFGLDLMPDAGYPPVQYGGWHTDRAKWYRRPWVHNLVLVDRREDCVSYDSEEGRDKRCRMQLWYDSAPIRAMSVNVPGHYGTSLYERTICMVDLDENHSVIFDVFRVRGGHEHIRMMHSTFGECRISGFGETEAIGFPEDILLGDTRGERFVSAPVAGADWTAEDRYGLNHGHRDVHLACYDLTEQRGLYRTTMWVNAGDINTHAEDGVTALLCVRTGEESLESCFESVLVPYERTNPVVQIEKTGPLSCRLTLTGGGKLDVGFTFDNGDIIICVEKEGKKTYVSNRVSE